MTYLQRINYYDKKIEKAKEKNIFKKAYKNTAVCLCKKCAQELVRDIKDWSDSK